MKKLTVAIILTLLMGTIMAEPKAEVTPAPKAEVNPAPKAEVTPAPKAEVNPAPKAEVTPAPKAEVTPAPKAEVTPAPKAEVKPAPKAEVKPAPKAEVNPAPIQFSVNDSLELVRLKAKRDSVNSLLNPKIDSLEAIEEAIKEASRPVGIGGAGGLIVKLYAIDVQPIKDYIASDIANLGDSSLYYGLGLDTQMNGQYETFFSTGARGLYGVGNGIKVGGEFLNSWRTYRATKNDTTFRTKAYIVYGGGIFDKSWSVNSNTFSIGLMMGGGAIGVSTYSYIDNSNNDSSDYIIDFNNDWTTNNAPLFAGDLHFSYNYSITPWLHLGFEANSLMLASFSGFKYGETFTTLNPGGGIKLMFGRVN